MSVKIPQNAVGELLVRLSGTEPTSRMADRYRAKGDVLAAPGIGEHPSAEKTVTLAELRERAERSAEGWRTRRPKPGTDHLLRREVDETTASVLRNLKEAQLKKLLAEIRSGDPAEALKL